MKRARTSSSHSQSAAPRGVLGWIRRRVLPKLAKLSALAGLIILGAWITGRVLTDQYQWSQYIWWAPSIWMLGSAWLLLILSAALAVFARRLGGIFLRPALLFANIGCTGFLIFGVWHMHRALMPAKLPDGSVRVIHWNQSSKEVDQKGFADFVFDQHADIVLVSNTSWGQDKQLLLDSLAALAPHENKRWVNYSFRAFVDPAHFRIESDVFIASKFPLVRTGMVRISTPVNQNNPLRPNGGRGWVLFAEFDLSDQTSEPQAEPEPFIVWLVDLPSDPLAWRQETMRKATDAIASWNGHTSIMGRHVWETFETNDSFPAPDLIIGDFNTLGGSDSLDRLAPNMTDAFTQAGYGRGRSWILNTKNRYLRQPIKLADWHIDLSLVGENWRTVRYRIEDTRQWGWTEHRMQVLDIFR